jgi:hydroxymethylbilane synthase
LPGWRGFAAVIDHRYRSIVVEKTIRIGTRGSDLAQAQTRLVIDALAPNSPGISFQAKIIKTLGDEKNGPVKDVRAGRKGLFTHEIERALLAGEIDIAVHSAKDLPSVLTAGTEIGCVLPRAVTDDMLILKNTVAEIADLNQTAANALSALPAGATVATGSVRRQRQLRWKRPDLNVVELRGNVPTRLRKLNQNDWAAIILARAGLQRLGIHGSNFEFDGALYPAHPLPPDIFVPAGGQGIIAVQCRAGEHEVKSIIRRIDDQETDYCLRAEREFLRLLNGDCNQPVGVLATIADRKMKIRAQIFDGNNSEPRSEVIAGNPADHGKLAGKLFEQISKGIDRAGPEHDED